MKQEDFYSLLAKLSKYLDIRPDEPNITIYFMPDHEVQFYMDGNVQTNIQFKEKDLADFNCKVWRHNLTDQELAVYDTTEIPF